MKTVSILGCGWYGKALGLALLKEGFTVKGSTTSSEKLTDFAAIGIKPYLINLSAEGIAYDPDFFDCDVLIISIPPNIRKTSGDDFIQKIERLIEVIKKHQAAQVIYISSTGVYGDDQGVVDEQTIPQPDTESGKIMYEAEKLLQQASGFKITVIRFGGLVGPNRHPGRFFAGKKDIPNGQSPVNLIHLDDAVCITLSLIAKQAYGHVFNACSPDHPHKADFYRMATQHFGAELPQFKDELISSKVVNCLNANKVLKYKFKVTDWWTVYGA
ncbi:SDR family oxidoreductase [Mucilaginibacter agri]|uniref:NAD(P)H-binding protein n=1 Tax=Mucilaginibacter agri TaxID=2695265 RepID=A0A965ZFQ8_9SPHI|nr:SDR family oxidoreductase [Mucilaginibacter agri]NCD70218.1 NAD(P)H-binding protein [Mucilaginibacter agri]